MNDENPNQYTDDVPADFDFYDVGELAAKSALVLKLNALIASRGLSDADSAALAEMTRRWSRPNSATGCVTFRWNC
ncbi:helix-turn-helix domain-containing protein [Burkholderia orbicola]|uniref:helix-turn-helix domain-containing protein n=1 Tax=Burkholderia cepacia complex TaxID=87882 RepID=UPI00201272EF|nr:MULTISPECIES: helix-turn-helix domain-containing protein [Burkholderia cepacia complex]MDN7472309.1 helix-turn-helix domain-containing protein [Burkholderia orbicola]MDN7506484.1 helix-turn-helix domain-containing protein [Burkholderia orbicola]